MSQALLRLSLGFVVAALMLAAASLYLSTRYMEEQQRLANTGDLEGAMQSVELAARLDPFSAEPLEDKAYLLQREEETRAAEDAFMAAADRDPGDYLIYQALGDLRSQSSRPREAAQSYEKALDLNPRESYARSGLATAYLSAGDLEEAKTQHERLRELEGLDVSSLYDLGRIYVRTGEPGKGVEALREAERRAAGELGSLDGQQRQQQIEFIQSAELAIADGLVVQRRYAEARQIVAGSEADQAPAVLSLIDSNPEGYRRTVRDSDVY